MGKKLDKSLKLLVRTSFIVLIGLFLSKVLGYIYRIIIARSFGPEVYGLFTLALLFLSLFVAFASMGLGEGILRQISIFRGKGQKSNIAYIFQISRIISIVTSLIAAVFLWSLSDFIAVTLFHNLSLIIFLKISAVIIPFYVLANTYLAAIRAFEKIGWYSFIINILQNFIRVLAIYLLIIFGIKTNSVMLSYLLSIIAMFIASEIICRKYLPEIFIKTKIVDNNKKKIINDLFVYSMPLVFSSFLYMVYNWIDSFSIGYLKTATEVGLYNAAVPIALLLAVIPDLFIQLLYPMITREYSRNNIKIVKELSKQVAKWIFVIALPAFLLIFIFPGAAINLLFGSTYLIAENSLRILIFGAFVSVLNGFLTTLLLVTGRSKLILFNLIFTSLINFILNFILIPPYGIIGAAIATSISWIILSAILFIQVNRYLSVIPLRKKMIKIAIVSLIPLIFLLLIKRFVLLNIINLGLLAFFFIVAYLILILVTGCLDRNDMEIIYSIKKKILQILPSTKYLFD